MMPTFRYRSGFEKQVAQGLMRQGVLFTYEDMRLPYHKTCSYVPDFFLKKQNIHIECKGRFLPQDRKKHLLIKQQHPDLDVRFVFQNANLRLSKASKTTYAQWCVKHGFLWAHQHIPYSWLERGFF